MESISKKKRDDEEAEGDERRHGSSASKKLRTPTSRLSGSASRESLGALMKTPTMPPLDGAGTSSKKKSRSKKKKKLRASMSHGDLGGHHATTAMDMRGEVWAWGDSGLGQLGTVQETPLSAQVVGRAHALAGGYDTLVLLDEEGAHGAVGEEHVVVVEAPAPSRDVKGWGSTCRGELGSVSDEVVAQSEAVSIPLSISGGASVIQVACGAHHVMALLSDGVVLAWGANERHQLGRGGPSSPLPLHVPGLWSERIVHIACGCNHSLALTHAGHVYGWGANEHHQIRTSGSMDVMNCIRIMENNMDNDMVITQVQGGGDSTAMISTLHHLYVLGRYACHHTNVSGPLSLSHTHGVVVTSDGRLMGWGDSRRGALNLPPRLPASTSTSYCSQLVTGHHWTAMLITSTPARFAAVGNTPSAFEGASSLMSLARRALDDPLSRHDARLHRACHHLGMLMLKRTVPSAEAAVLVGRLLEEELHESSPKSDEAEAEQHEDAMLRAWVSACQTYLSERLMTDRAVSRQHGTLGVIRLVGRLRRLTPSSVAPTRFYNDVVSRRFDVEADFDRWHQHHDLFSFCGEAPFLLHPAAKAAVLREEARMQMDEAYANAMVRGMFGGRAPASPYLEMVVRRDYLIQDSLERLAELEHRPHAHRYLRKQLKVTFEGEQGLDEGGVKKEYFLLLVRQLFRPEYALVTWNEERTQCWFNNTALENESEFKLVGMVFGLAIYNSIVLDVHFPPLVYTYLLDPEYEPVLDDLQEAFPQLCDGLRSLLAYDGGDEEDVFCLVMSVSVEAFGVVSSHDLVADGSNIAVTASNKHEYVERYVRFILRDSVLGPLQAFCAGFHLVAKRKGFLQHVLPVELERIVCGYPHWNLEELKRVASYEGGYQPDSPLIQWFWHIVSNVLSVHDQHQLLSFVTGSDRVPVGGFAEMDFVIQRAGGDSEKLPTSHTCFNTLLLPEYSTQDKLAEKLKVAISQCEGFGLI